MIDPKRGLLLLGGVTAGAVVWEGGADPDIYPPQRIPIKFTHDYHTRKPSDVTDAKGTVTHWGAELLPNPAQLINTGWSKKRSTEALMPGTVITITIAPSKAGGTVGLLIKAVNDKGEELVPAGGAGGPGAPPAP